MFEKTVWIEDITVRLNDIGPDGHMRSHIAMDFMQDAAARHAAYFGIGLPNLRELGIAWVLSRLKFKMDKYPSFDDVVRITTWPSGVQKLFCSRQYELTNAKTGEYFGCGTSLWLTLDMKSLRPLNPAKSLPIDLPKNTERPVFFPDIDKITPREDLTDPLPHLIATSEIDYNNHLNNTYYGLFAQDWIGTKINSLVRIDEIQLNFNCGMRFGETLVCSGVAEDGLFQIEGTAPDSKNAFRATGKYSKITI